LNRAHCRPALHWDQGRRHWGTDCDLAPQRDLRQRLAVARV